MNTIIANLASPTDDFMLSTVEANVRAKLLSHGLTVPINKSRSSKELEVLLDGETVAYISRKTSLKKGLLVISVHPRFLSSLDQQFHGITGIQARTVKGSRFISSSNYKGFNSKEWTSEITTQEHIAVSFSVEFDGEMRNLSQFIDVLLSLKH